MPQYINIIVDLLGTIFIVLFSIYRTFWRLDCAYSVGPSLVHSTKLNRLYSFLLNKKRTMKKIKKCITVLKKLV